MRGAVRAGALKSEGAGPGYGWTDHRPEILTTGPHFQGLAEDLTPEQGDTLLSLCPCVPAPRWPPVVAGGSGATATTATLAQAGASVAVLAHSVQEVDRTVDELRAAGHRAAGSSGDVADAAALADALHRLTGEPGSIAVLVNAGSAGRSGRPPAATPSSSTPGPW